jgi:hypothetical protein
MINHAEQCSSYGQTIYDIPADFFSFFNYLQVDTYIFKVYLKIKEYKKICQIWFWFLETRKSNRSTQRVKIIKLFLFYYFVRSLNNGILSIF